MRPSLRLILSALPWLLVGILACSATLLVMAPASWVTPYVGAASAHRLELSQATGSLWQGEATLMLGSGRDPEAAPGDGGGSNAPAPTVLPGRVAWHTAFWPLWRGQLQIAISQSAAMPQAVELDLDRHQTSLSGGSLHLPATVFAGLGSPFNTLDLKGDLRLDWTPCRLLGNQAYGQMNLTVTDLGSRVSRISPLGSYRLRLELNGGNANLLLATLRGPLLLEGQGNASLNSFNFDGTARAAPGFEDGLTGFLHILGTRRDDGSYSLRTMP